MGKKTEIKKRKTWIILSRFLFSPQDLIYEIFNNFIMTEKEAEDLCKMIRIGVDLSKPNYKYYPETKDELIDLIEKLIEERGNEADLNDVDVSRITDMSYVFQGSQFNGDISKWNVSRVKSMEGMFCESKFNGDISKWNVSGVVDMSWMFEESQFNGDISNWNVSGVVDMSWMFEESQFNGDISNWNVSGVKDMCGMFESSEFNGDISKWAKKPE